MKCIKTGPARSRQPNVLSAVVFTLLLGTADSYAQEQFFFNDDSEPVQFASTPDGQTKFAVYGALAVTEGDIVLGNAFDLIHGKQTPRGLNRGLARTTKLDRWVDGLVYFEISAEIASSEREKVYQAVEHWNENTSVSFIERTAANADSVPNYITVVSGPGCGSYVGLVGGAQELWVNSKCTTGSVIHELGHAVGLFHEHTRADRDSYITIIYDNIDEETSFNFDIMDDGIETVLSYDYASIMHYGTTFFSKNGNPTIAVPDGISIGQREGLSATDIASVDVMYATDLSLATTVSPDEEDSENVILEVMVSNIGELGANTLLYSLPLNPGHSGIGFAGADWNCSSNSNIINCTRETLADGASSTLSLKINVASSNEQALGAGYLSAKTFDLDLSNNGDKPDTPTDTAVTDPVPDNTPTTTAGNDPDSEPETDSVEPEPVSAEASGAPAADGSAGSAGWILLLVAGYTHLLRRRVLDSAD